MKLIRNVRPISSLVVMIIALVWLLNANISHGQQNVEIISVRWNSAGNLIATLMADGFVRVDDVQTNQTLWQHQLGEFQPRIAWNPQVGSELAISAYEYGAEVWDVQTGQRILQLQTSGWIRDIAYDLSGNRIATAHGQSTPLGGGKIQFWNSQNGQLILETSTVGRYLTSLSWSPSGDRIGAIDGDTGQAVIYDTQTGQLLNALPPLESDSVQLLPLTKIRWSPLMDSFLTYAGGVEISLWNALTYEVSEVWAFSGGINDIQFDDSGNRVAIATDVRVLVVNLSGDIVLEIPVDKRANSVSWMPNSEILTFGGEMTIETVDVTPTLPTLAALCTLDPATTRNWRITNLNAAELAVTWQLFNSPTQMGTVTIPANGTLDFSTTVEPNNETMRLIVGGQLVAEATGSAEPCGGTATPTPTSTPSPEVTPTPTATGTLEPTATPTETPTSTPSPEATLTPTATAMGTLPPTGSTFYRAVNLGGPALTIGGNAWEANETTTADFSTNGFVLCNPWLTFNPAASGAQAEMLSCWREHWAHDMAMSNMPSGIYEVYIYALQSWNNIEGNIPYGIQLEGVAVDSYTPGTADGVWSRRGPFTVTVTDGALNVTTTDTIAVLTGLEVYRLNTATPTPSPATPTPTPTDPPAPTETPTPEPTPTPTPTVTPTGTPPAETFYRAVNLGGPALTIDGRNWEANETTTPNFFSNGYLLCNPWLTFNPAASGAQSDMLSCWREHWAHSMSMSAMPSGTYQVYVYVLQSWNDPAGVDPFTLRLEGAVVDSYAPGVVDGVWVRRGPFTVSVTDGALNLTTQDGNPVLTGLEVYSIGG